MTICLHMCPQEECLHCLRAEVEQLRKESAQMWTYILRQPCTCDPQQSGKACERCFALVGGH